MFARLLRRLFAPRGPDTPAAVWAALRSAAARGDGRRLAALCGAHRDVIGDHFAAWRVVPEADRGDRARAEAYVHALMTVAGYFERSGDPSLMRALVGTPEENPLLTWPDDLDKAERWLADGDAGAAVGLLERRLKTHEHHTGTGVDRFRPVTHGLLGKAYHALGDAPAAVNHTETALRLCRETGDADGVRVYTENLRRLRDG